MNVDINKLFGDLKSHPLEYITLALAILGATFASDLDAGIRGLGFFLWIFSNGYMLIGFLKLKNIPYSLLFLGYEIMNIRGMLNAWYW